MDEIRDGSLVECGQCGKQARVRIFKRDKIALLGPEAMASMQSDNVALKCQQCGHVMCFSCAFSNTGSVGIPSCPACKAEGGPYFFVAEE